MKSNEIKTMSKERTDVLVCLFVSAELKYKKKGGWTNEKKKKKKKRFSEKIYSELV